MTECTEQGATLYTYGEIDDLTYTYNADKSRLTSIGDAATGVAGTKGYASPGGAYDYDRNGNMRRDDNKDFLIAYNHLNLPREISRPWESIEQPGGVIRITYDATGRKLKKTVYDHGGTVIQTYILYANGIEKEVVNHAGNTTTYNTFVTTAEGRVALYQPGTPPVGYVAKWEYEYTLRDHLGNARLMVSDKNADGFIQASSGDYGGATGYTEILEETHYYPFGMEMEGKWREPALPRTENRYGYNGKELNSDLGLGWNDYGARWYDASVGRWWSVDPLAETTVDWSGYNYTFNNPIKYIDPTGMKPEWVPPTAAEQQAKWAKERAERKGQRSEDKGEAFKNTIAEYFGQQTDCCPQVVVNAAYWVNGAIATDVVVPDPSDVALPKWIVEAILGGVSTTIIALHVPELIMDEPGLTSWEADKITAKDALRRMRNSSQHIVYVIMGMNHDSGLTEVMKYGTAAKSAEDARLYSSTRDVRIRFENDYMVFDARRIATVPDKATAIALEAYLHGHYAATTGTFPVATDPRYLREALAMYHRIRLGLKP